MIGRDQGAVGAFGAVVLVAIAVTAASLAFVSIVPEDEGGRVGVRDVWVPVNVSGSGERWDGHAYRVEGVVGAPSVDAVITHNGSRYAVELEAGTEVWLPCPSSGTPSSSVAIEGERASWWANLPCHVDGGGGPPSSEGGDGTGTDEDLGGCERHVWVSGEDVAQGPCILEGGSL